MKKICKFSKKTFKVFLCITLIFSYFLILDDEKAYATNLTTENTFYNIISNNNGNITLDKDYVVNLSSPISIIFDGNLNGNGHTITIKGGISASKKNLGLFQTISGATIENLNIVIDGTLTGEEYLGGLAGHIQNSTIRNVTVQGNLDGTYYVGGIAGSVKDSKLENVTFDGNLNQILGRNTVSFAYIGGIAGYVENTTIKKASNNGSITSSGFDVGGIVGHAKNSSIFEGTNKGEVTGSTYVGGIIGYAIDSNVYGETESTINEGTINSKITYAGGIVGRSDRGEIIDVQNNGNINGCTEGRNIKYDLCWTGGIVGSSFGADISNAHNTADITANGNRVGGIAGQVSDQTKINYSTNKGKITGDNWSSLGGIVGYAANKSELNNLENSGDVTGKKELGGIAGYATENSWINVATNNGKIVSVNVDDENRSYVGGILGYGDPVDVKNAANNADITGKGSYVGGIVGGMNSEGKNESVIDNVSNKGVIYSEAENDENGIFSGGIISSIWNTTINNAKNYGRVEGKGSVGGIVSYAKNSEIENVYNATVDEGIILKESAYKESSAGGIVASAIDTSIKNAVNIGRISADSGSAYGIGGIVGYAFGEKEMTFENLQNENLVTSGENSDGRSYVGGIVGNIDNKIVVKNSYNKGEINGDGTHTGGIVGRIVNNSTIHNATNEGKIKGASYTGGIAGAGKGSTIKNSINKASVSGDTNVGGIAGYIEGSTSESVLNVTEEISGSDNSGLLFGGTEGLTIYKGAYTLKENENNKGYGSGEPKIVTPGRVQGYKASELKEEKVKNEDTNDEEKETYEGFDFKEIWYMSENYADLSYAKDLKFEFIDNDEDAKNSYEDAKDKVSSGSVGGSSNDDGSSSSSNNSSSNGNSSSGGSTSSGSSSSGGSSSSSSGGSSNSGSTSSGSTNNSEGEKEEKIIKVDIQFNGSDLDIDNYLYNDGRTFVDINTFCSKTSTCTSKLINGTYEITKSENLLNQENGEYTYLVEHKANSKTFKSSIIIGGRKIVDDENTQTATDVESCPADGNIECDRIKFFVPIRFLAQALGYKVEWDGDNEVVKIDSTFEEDFNEKYETSIVEGKCESNIKDCTVLEKDSNNTYLVEEDKEYYICVSEKESGDIKTFSKYFSFYDEVEQEGESEPYIYTVKPFQISANKLLINNSNNSNTNNDSEALNEDSDDDKINNDTTDEAENSNNKIDESENIKIDDTNENDESQSLTENSINIAQIIIYRIDESDEDYKTENYNSGSYPFVINSKFALKNYE